MIDVLVCECPFKDAGWCGSGHGIRKLDIYRAGVFFLLRGFEKSRLGIHKRQLALIELYLRKDLSRCILFFYNSPYRLPWWYSFRGACRLEKVSQGGLSGHLFDRLLAPLAILSFGLRFAEKRPDEGTLIHSDDWLGESNPGLPLFWPCFDSGGR